MSAWSQRGDRRGPPPPPPLPRRPPPPPHRAVNDQWGEDSSSAVRTREEAEGAAAGGTGRGAGAGDRTATAVAEHGARAQEAREVQGSDGAERKRSLVLPAQPQPKRSSRAVTRARRGDPHEYWKTTAVALGRKGDADGSRHRAASAAGGGGPGAPGKEAPRPPLPTTKDDALPRAAGTSLLNKVPVEGDGHRGADTRAAKSPYASRRSSVPAADDGLSDTDSHGAAGYVVDHRGRSEGTSELQRKKNGP
jgi:hypothetical protein